MREKLARLIKSRMATERYGWAGHLRWPLLSIVVGIVSGLGAILFEELLRQALYHFLHLSTGFFEPLRGSEAATVNALADIRSPLFSLPVVLPPRDKVVVGILKIEDVLTAYNQRLLKDQTFGPSEPGPVTPL